MARIHYVEKARKQQGRCSTCGREINKGDSYKHVEPRYLPRVVACSTCSIPQSKLHSGYLADVYVACEDFGRWKKECTKSPEDLEELNSILEVHSEAMENDADVMEENADSIYEYFPSSELAENLEERASACREAAGSMANLSHLLEDDEVNWEEVEDNLNDIEGKLEEAEETI